VSPSVIEAVVSCREGGVLVSHLIIYSLWPVPIDEIRKALRGVKKVIVPELNLGLYKREVERLMSDDQKIISINKMDGTQISPSEISQIISSS
jgi:2-oxoglutarate ferredoxin oxidoreductase subunit alpha